VVSGWYRGKYRRYRYPADTGGIGRYPTPDTGIGLSLIFMEALSENCGRFLSETHQTSAFFDTHGYTPKPETAVQFSRSVRYGLAHSDNTVTTDTSHVSSNNWHMTGKIVDEISFKP